MFQLFGIGNKARQGKDTVGEHLKTKYGFEILHFADTLKSEAIDWGWDPENKNESAISILQKYISLDNKQTDEGFNDLFLISFNIAKQNPYMSFLQWLGSYRRNQDKDYWITKTFKKIDRISYDTDKKYAICDMRYINELKSIKGVTGITLNVQRYVDGKRYIDPERDPYHPSETELDGIPHDFVISANEGDMKSLFIQVDNIIKYLNWG